MTPPGLNLEMPRRPAASQTVGVLHVVDALRVGGAERVAVNLVNLLDGTYVPYLCTTREEGPLSGLVAPHVGRLVLQRRSRFDPAAIHRFGRFLEENRIRIVHAHASALFFARAATLGRSCAVVWHDHYGLADSIDRPAALYWAATRGIAGVIGVNQTLCQWARRSLRLPPERVWYVPNLVPDAEVSPGAGPILPGRDGARIVCVANFRRQKDHLNLLAAMTLVAAAVPAAHLLLVGDSADPEYVRFLRARCSSMGLNGSVAFLGPRQDVAAILRACDVGVLGSASEGLPLALLEYGRASLGSVATAVGQCPEVLDHGASGILVPPSSPEELSRAIVGLLKDAGRRRELGARFHKRVQETYGPRKIMRQIYNVYENVLRECR